MRREGRAASAPQTWPFGVAWSQARGWYWTDEVEKVVRLFELFTSGMTAYNQLTQETAIPYANIPIILRNPIYSGWKVYDSKRDGTAKGKVLDEMGRLRYQRKVKRVEEEIIRVRVFDKGIISDAMWAKAQQLLAFRKEMHQRRGKGEGLDRFLYRGFLKCGVCSDIMYTIPKRYGNVIRDYYVCRRKRGYGQTYRPGKPVAWQIAPGSCATHQLSRERLEPLIDEVLSERLTDPQFLDGLLDRHEQAGKKSDNRERIQRVRREIAANAEKQERLMDLYIDGKLSKEQHAQRLVKLEQELKAGQKTLSDLAGEEMPLGVSAEDLAELLQPFYNWEFMQAEDKRRLLSTVVPAIKVSDYKVNGIYLALAGEHDGHNDDGPEDGAGTGRKKCSRIRANRVNTGESRVANMQNRRATVSLIDHPVYLPIM
jgi:hypothetical protein